MPTKDTLSRRAFLKGTGGVAGASVLAGCDGGGTGSPTEDSTEETTDSEAETSEESSPSDVTTGGTLNMINSTMTTLDPIAVGDSASGMVVNQCYEGLMTYPDGHPSPEQGLATGYETSDDFLEYTFTLPEGVQFQNDMGELTASDVVYSWERLAASENSKRKYFILDSLAIKAKNQNGNTFRTTAKDTYQPGSMQLEATGDYEVSFTLKRAFHATLQMLAYGNFEVHPEGIVGDIEGYDGEVDYDTLANSESYGTGPFQVDAWQKGDSATVTKFEGFRRDGEPYLDAINWAIIEKAEPRYRYSTNKNADLLIIPTSYYNPDKISIEEERDGKEFGTYGPLESGSASGESVDIVRHPDIVTRYLGFNVANTERAVREAMAYVINRQEIADDVFKGRLKPGFHLTPPPIFPGGVEGYDEHVADAYPYETNTSQIDQAKQVMEDAGYGPDNKYDLTINSYPGIYTEMVRGLRDKLSAAHVNVTVEPTQFATIIEKGQNGTLQAYTLGWIADWPRPDNFLQLIAPSKTDVAELGQSALTYTNWSELDTDAKTQAEEAYNTIQNNLQPSDAAEQQRVEAYMQMEEANWEDLVLINIGHDTAERFSWPSVHVNPVGGMGKSRQTHYTSWKEQ